MWKLFRRIRPKLTAGCVVVVVGGGGGGGGGGGAPAAAAASVAVKPSTNKSQNGLRNDWKFST